MVTAVKSPAPSSDGVDKRPRRSKEERKKRAANRKPKSEINTLVFNPFFVLLGGLLVISCLISFFLVFSHPEGAWGQNASNADAANAKIPPKPKAGENPYMDQKHLTFKEQEEAMKHGIRKAANAGPNGDDGKGEEDDEGSGSGSGSGDDGGSGDDAAGGSGDRGEDASSGDDGDSKEEVKYAERFSAFDPELTPKYANIKPFDTTLETPHLLPKVPVLPIFAEIENGKQLVDDLLHNNKPTIAGIVAFLSDYLKQLHEQNKNISKKESRKNTGENINEMTFVNSYFNLTKTVIDPLENAYRGRTIFPVREDGSLFVSLAAFREHLLGKSMMSAFDNAKDPSKLFIGAVVQNCFGLDGTVCKTGLQVVGKDKNGRDRTSVSPKPPDENGIEEFCTHKDYKKYCDSGQVRALYLHDTDALGPQTARFYASKLWGGENYFMQMDAHLEFAPDWDKYYIDEVKAAKNYPKSILSAYPPGFKDYDGNFKGGGRGERLCGAHFSKSPVEYFILRIEQLGLTPRDAKRPTQIPFMAAGFFFAHSDLLRDVPFDPYAPWCFMGEEIALSMRSWTNGWNIYAPRKNVIAHQYRPGRLGLPKFWESVGRDSNRGSLNTRLQRHVLRRVKHMLAYPTDSREKITTDGDAISLYNFEHYSMGHERKLEDYLQWTKINPTKVTTGKMDWCLNAELE
jgi:hypothetical protein